MSWVRFHEAPVRYLSTLPSVRSSVRKLGTRVEANALISNCIRALPTRVSGSATIAEDYTRHAGLDHA